MLLILSVICHGAATFEEIVYEKEIKNRLYCYQMKAKVVFDEIFD